ncbi:MAG: hypothetical protein ABJD97_12905, partial [Betaproteobacteria bacterium]
PRSLKLALVGLAVLMAVLLWTLLQARNPTPVNPDTNAIPDTGQSVNTPAQADPRIVVYGVIGRVLICGTPLLAWLAFRRARRDRESALARESSNAPDAARLHPGDQGLRLFDLDGARQIDARAGQSPKARERLRTLSDGLRYAMEGLRLRRQVVARRIDARASARASAGHAGLPRWVWRRRSAKADYPVLIDTRSGRDHLLVLGRAFAARMQRAGIEHTRYLFGGDPRALREDRPNARFHSLESIGSTFDHATLIVISTGEFLEEAASLRDGSRGSLLALLAQWQRVVLLTPLPQHQWTWRERRIESLGVIVLPLTPEGLRTLGDRMRVGPGERPARRRQRVAPPTALSNEEAWAIKWHSDVPPGEDDREALLDAIAMALPPVGLEWLGVLALFPELRPELTLHVATTLRQADGALAVDEADYAALCSLPWLRAGRMPDWLRLELVRSLSPEALARARDVLDRWLVRAASTATVSNQAMPLQIAAARERVKAEIGGDPGSAYRDAIFLRFLDGGELQTLDLKAPIELVERLSREQAAKDRRSAVVAIGASAILAASSLLLKNPLGVIEIKSVALIGIVSTLTMFGLLRGFADSTSETWQRAASVAGLSSLPALGLCIWISRVDPIHSTAIPFVLAVAAVPTAALPFGWRRRRLPLPIVDSRQYEASDIGGAIVCLLSMLMLPATSFVKLLDEPQVLIWIATGSLFSLGLAWVYASRFGVAVRFVAAHAICAVLLFFPVLTSPLSGSEQSRMLESSWYLTVPLAANAGCIAAVGASRDMAWRWALAASVLGLVAVLCAAGFEPYLASNNSLLLVGLIAPTAIVAGLSLGRPYRRIATLAGLVPILVLFAAFAAWLVRQALDPLHSALPLLLVPATLSWWRLLEDRAEQPATSQLQWRALIPNASLVYVPAMWLFGLANTLLPAIGAQPTLRVPSIATAMIPLTAAFARSSATISWPLVCLGILPICLPIQKTMPSLNAGIALCCLAIYGLVTSPATRSLLGRLGDITWQRLLAVMLVLGLEFQLRPRQTVGLIDAALWLVMLCGLMHVRRLVAIPALLVVAASEWLAQWWRVDGVLVFDCITPVTGIVLFETARRISIVDAPPSIGARSTARALAPAIGASVAVMACAYAENLITLRIQGGSPADILSAEVWGPDAATLLAFGAFVIGLAGERDRLRRLRDGAGKEGVVIVTTLFGPIQMAVALASIVVAFVVAWMGSSRVAGALLVATIVPMLFVALGRGAVKWLPGDGSGVLRAPIEATAPQSWQSWLPTAAVIAPMSLIVFSMLHSDSVKLTLTPALAATTARGVGALCVATAAIAGARMAGLVASGQRWRTVGLYVVAGVIFAASWVVQPLAQLYPVPAQPEPYSARAAQPEATPVPSGAASAADGAAARA